MGQLIVLKANEPTATVESCDKATLEQVQELVGGYIQTVPYFDHWNGEPAQAWCDEDGKLKGYMLNEVATQQWNEILKLHHGIAVNHDYLVGDIVILTGSAMLD